MCLILFMKVSVCFESMHGRFLAYESIIKSNSHTMMKQ